MPANDHPEAVRPPTDPCQSLVIQHHAAPGCHLGHTLDRCPDCADYRPGLNRIERQRCEVWTRVMGYHRPVHAFNPGKQAEHRDRQTFREPAGDLVGAGLPAIDPAPATAPEVSGV